MRLSAGRKQSDYLAVSYVKPNAHTSNFVLGVSTSDGGKEARFRTDSTAPDPSRSNLDGIQAEFVLRFFGNVNNPSKDMEKMLNFLEPSFSNFAIFSDLFIVDYRI